MKYAQTEWTSTVKEIDKMYLTIWHRTNAEKQFCPLCDKNYEEDTGYCHYCKEFVA